MLGQLVQNFALAVALLLTGAGNVARDAHDGGGGPSDDVDKGAICVVLGPTDAVKAGAKWTIDSSTRAHASGETVRDLPVGTHMVRFSSVRGFVAPSATAVVVREERTTQLKATYSAAQATGALKVTLAPSAAVSKGAKWLLDSSSTLHASGETVSGLSAGTHTVRFSAVAGYNTPANQAVTIVGGQTAAASGTYTTTAANGSLLVTMAPSAAVTAGARWMLDSTTTQRVSGVTLAGVAPGTHTIRFTAVTGYTTPANQNVTVVSGQTATVNATYVATAAKGSVKVTLAPAAAVTAGAKWKLDSSATLYASGATVANLAVGTHTVSFTAVAGYTTPASQTVTVVSGGTATITATYTAAPTTGSLLVTMAPGAAVTAGARWLLDSSTTQHTSGVALTGVTPGAHTVKFTAVAGYTTPANQTVTVVAGQTATVNASYGVIAATGSVKVTLAPAAAVTAGAQWKLDSSATLYASGATVANLTVGTHTVSFTAVTGYTTPANQTVTVVSGATATVTGTYVAQPATGSVKVTLAPAAAVTAGAKWKLDSSATLYASGATVASLTAGTHTVSFTAVAGYTTPANQTVTVVSGATASVTGTYVAQPATGSVKVTIAPAAAISAGAQWKVDSSATLNASGATVANLTAGSHTVSFTAATGYATPANQTVTVTAGSTTSVTVTYTSLISFAATIQPAAAASCSCHGSTMTNRATLISTGRVVPGNANASPYVTKTSMQAYWGTLRQTVIDWINQGANP